MFKLKKAGSKFDKETATFRFDSGTDISSVDTIFCS